MSTNPAYKNVILLLADQLRQDAPAYAGGPAITPNMDLLARRGTVFANAYTPMPVCGPARRALLSGRHPDSYGSFWNQSFFPTPPFSPENTLVQRFSKAGYRCGFIGKWDIEKGSTPESFGFSHSVLKEEHRVDLKQRYPNLSLSDDWMGCESPVAVEHAETHFLANHAVDFIAQAQEEFFLWVDFGAPHLPCQPSLPFADWYAPEDIPPWLGYNDTFENKPYCHRQQVINWRLEDTPWSEMAQQVARYYGMVSQLDDAIGKILGALVQRGALEETLIVLTSDHGDMCGNHRMLDKHYVMYDDIVRVPLVVSGAGLEGCVSNALVSNCLDLPPTLCEMMNLAPLSDPHGLPLPFQGEQGREYITSSSNGQQFGFYNTRMITDSHYKYVWNLTDTDEFYCFADDPGECHNAIHAPQYQNRVGTMRKALYQQLAAHEDPLLSHWTAPQLLEGRKQ